MEFSKTRLSFRRPLTSYSKAKPVMEFLCRNRRWHIRKSTFGKRYLNIGCGPHIHDHCINLDYSYSPSLDICWDITKGLPLSDNSIVGIFTEHCFEHINIQDIQLVLAECFRVLSTDGTLRIVVPDGELYLRCYVQVMDGVHGARMPTTDTDESVGVSAPIVAVNRIFRDYGHRFIYDFSTLSQLLTKAGFSNIAKQQFNVGHDPRILLDTPSRSVESLYVEARKK